MASPHPEGDLKVKSLHSFRPMVAPKNGAGQGPFPPNFQFLPHWRQDPFQSTLIGDRSLELLSCIFFFCLLQLLRVAKAAFRLSITSMDVTVKHYIPLSPPLRFLSVLFSSVRSYWCLDVLKRAEKKKSRQWEGRKVVFDSHVHGRNW